MKVTISEAARMVGIKSRSTFYRHIDKKGITIERDEDDNPVVDVSELVRVYGDRVQIDTEKSNSPIHNTTAVNTAISEDMVPLSVFNKMQEQLEELYNARIDDLKAQLDSQMRHNTLLLEDQRSEKSRVGEWEEQFQLMKENLANQEIQVEKILNDNKRLKKIALRQKQNLDREKNKTFFQKLFWIR
jgi:hypothetical protein